MVPSIKHKINQPHNTRKNLTELTPICAVAAVEKADLAAMWSQPDSPEPVIIGQNKGFKMGDHDKSES
jgi:hypothetical protein